MSRRNAKLTKAKDHYWHTLYNLRAVRDLRDRLVKWLDAEVTEHEARVWEAKNRVTMLEEADEDK